MLDWLNEPDISLTPLTVRPVLMALAWSVLFGGCVALIYRYSHGRLKENASILTTTLVLLSVLIAMVSIVIGGSVARAFSLVGALSIVRFRTVVEDTRDTAFVIFAVIVGMAAGSQMTMVAMVGIPIVAALALGLSYVRTQLITEEPPDGTLTIRMGLGRDPETLLGQILARHFREYRLTTIETVRQGSAIEYKYRTQMWNSATMTALVNELNQIEGVLGVDLKT